ncbi:hypothetical protein EYF80_031634 [Liparis tanakae]|uniref:Uncharacterized protein n=1 Tax=Liparis tanakae TaxID=230148 RepID=A0A4Z2GXS4_9TELE|nr:hypothetical protein EYF80_031634 [Liparis tanakae]
METSTIHQADGGREEEWAESQQGSGVVGSRNSTTHNPDLDETEMLCLHLSPCETALLLPHALSSSLDSAVLTSTALRPMFPLVSRGSLVLGVQTPEDGTTGEQSPTEDKFKDQCRLFPVSRRRPDRPELPASRWWFHPPSSPCPVAGCLVSAPADPGSQCPG